MVNIKYESKSAEMRTIMLNTQMDWVKDSSAVPEACKDLLKSLHKIHNLYIIERSTTAGRSASFVSAAHRQCRHLAQALLAKYSDGYVFVYVLRIHNTSRYNAWLP